MNNEKTIKKADRKFKKTLWEKKKQWKSIRIDKELEIIRAMHDLMNAGIERKDAREIAEREAAEDESQFKFIASNYIAMKKKKLIKELGLTES